MPKGDEEIIKASEDKVEKALLLITNDTKEGVAKLLTIMKSALSQYEEPTKSWGLSGWVTHYTRTRGPEVQRAIDAIEKNPAYLNRLKEVYSLITKGKCTEGSFNVYLFLELIKNIPGAKEPRADRVVASVETFKAAVDENISSLIKNYEREQQAKKESAQKMEALQRERQQRADIAFIFNNLSEAQAAAKAAGNKPVFYLNFKATWELFLVDASGKAFLLKLTEELSSRLASHTGLNKTSGEVAKERPVLKAVHLNPLKPECIKAKDVFLAGIKLLINPSAADLKGKSSTFVLTQNEKTTSLSWINSCGVSNPIVLSDYPSLNAWLKEHRVNKNNAEDMMQLKLQLVAVETKRPVDARTASVLDSFFSRQHKSKDDVTTAAIAKEQAVAAMKLLDNPADSNEELAQENIRNTFILRLVTRRPNLWWADSFGRINKINLKDYPALSEWINTTAPRTRKLNTEEIAHVKLLLLDVNPSRSIETKKIKALDALLAPAFNKKLAAKPADKEVRQEPKKLTPDRMARIATLPAFWEIKSSEKYSAEKQAAREAAAAEELSAALSSAINAI